MRSASSLLAFGSLLVATFTTGCFYDPPSEPIRLFGDDSPGQLGKARFEFSSSNCELGCGLDRTALQGSMVTVIVNGGDANRRPSARLASPELGKIAQQKEDCSCANGSRASRS